MRNLFFPWSAIILFFATSITSYPQNRPTENWPRTIHLQQLSITIYQPEVEKIKGNYLEARAAFNIFDGTKLPVFGALWLRARIHINQTDQTITYDNIVILDVNFPDATVADKKEFKELLVAVAPTWQIKSTMADLHRASASIAINAAASATLNNNPPNIFYEQTPTELIYIDGEPILANIDGSVLYQYVVNTPHFIVYSVSDKFYYLKAGSWWFRAPELYAAWQSIGAPPQSIINLDNKFNNFNHQNNNELITNSSRKPQLYVVTHQAALIETRGEPDLYPIPNTRLSYVANTNNDLLRDNKTNEFYVRFSGRWYKSPTLFRGDWRFVPPDSLPVYFQKIPADSKIGYVRISIPGTPEAMQAALNNFIPQTAIVDRKTAEMTVEYDGEPVFEPITGTNLQYAINTNSSVLKTPENTFYAVDEAVWFKADSPAGPWVVATEVPDGVEKIPPSSPVYNIKYVYIYEYSPEYVYVGYTGGYLGAFLYQGCVFYGTGYQYKPWYKSKYIPRPVTYAFGINRTGGGSKGGNVRVSVGVGYGYPGFYSPYGYGYGMYPGIGIGIGNYSYATVNGNYTYKKGYESKPLDQVNIYNNRVRGIVATENVKRNNPYVVIAENQQAEDGSWVPPANMYSDAAGNVYKQDRSGTWHKREDGVWVKIKGSPPQE